MVEQRKFGTIESYNILQRTGMIRGQDGRKYYFQKMRVVNLQDPLPGMIVSFLVAPRPNEHGKIEVRDIRSENSIPEKLSEPEPEINEEIRQNDKKELEQAAREALRLKRARREGLLEPSVEDFPPGTRVVHPSFGYGAVVLAARDIVSVRLDDTTRVLDINRQELTKDTGTREILPASQHNPVVREVQSAKVAYQAFRRGRSIADYLHQLAAEVNQRVVEEGIEGDNIYRFEEPGAPSSPLQSIVIDPRVAQAFLKSKNITKFYSHQVQTRAALLAGKNVLIATPTASGKTEAYNPTILECLLNNPVATALYLFPLNALGFDQADRLEKLNQEFPASDQLVIGISNNNVPKEIKSAMLRAENRILVTTPESLHYIFLPKRYPNWQNFFRNLRYVVVDEAHIYKGVFGANMANILRRLLVRCRREGNLRFPQVIISSATINNHAQLAHQLTGLPGQEFEIITESGAPIPGKHFLVTRSDIHDLESICSDLLDITTHTIDNQERPVKTIVFLRSIKNVKQAALHLRDHLRSTGRPDKAALVEEYYSDKADKADVLLRMINNDQGCCVFATTALMAGIDIGSLDVAIVKNFPRLVMDARQMFGRAGRSGEGAVVFIADRKDPFDQFYFEKSGLLFKGDTENVICNPENPYLLAAHLQCAAQTQGQYNREGPLSGEFVGLFGETGKDLLDIMLQDDVLQIRAGSYHLNVSTDPHDVEPLDNIRSMSNETYTLKDVAGQLLEEKRLETAFRDAHKEALVWVNSQLFRVIDFDMQTHEITCEPHIEQGIRTSGVEEKSVEIKQVDAKDWTKQVPLGCGISLLTGEIEVSIDVNDYLVYKTTPVMQCRSRSCRFETPNLNILRCPKCNSPVRIKNVEKFESKLPVPTPPFLKRTLKTRAVWIDLSKSLREQFSKEFWPRWTGQENAGQSVGSQQPDFESALHSIEHAILKAFPEHVLCDPDEIAGVYQLGLPDLAGRLFIYDNFPGGLGYSDEFPNKARLALDSALDLIERCTCIDDEGCPVCLAYFGCSKFNQAISKLAGRYLLRVLLGKNNKSVLDDLDDYVNIRYPENQRLNGTMGIDHEKQSIGSSI